MNKIANIKYEVKLKQWKEMVQRRNESGLSVSEWCVCNGVNVKTYYYRLKRVRQALCIQIEHHDIVSVRPGYADQHFSGGYDLYNVFNGVNILNLF